MKTLTRAKTIAETLLTVYSKRVCEREFSSQKFTRFNERPVELAFVFRHFGRLYPRTVLDVGTGTTALPHVLRGCGSLVTAIDNVRDYWVTGMQNRHWHIVDDDITKTHLTETFDFITCISVLEHIEDVEATIRNLFVLLKPTGHLILTFPHSAGDYVRNVYDLPRSSYGRGAPYITQSFSETQVQEWLRQNEGIVHDQEYWRFWEGDYWTEGKQVIPPKAVAVSEQHQLTCVLVGQS